MFHEHRDLINNLDEEICEMEKSHADQFQVEIKKKEKLKLKDEIYNAILKHKNS